MMRRKNHHSTAIHLLDGLDFCRDFSSGPAYDTPKNYRAKQRQPLSPSGFQTPDRTE
jgi:hypothetical protein